MKKSLIILVSLFLLEFQGLAQITLLESDFGSIGDTFIVSIDSHLKSGFSVGSSGPNQTWDYSDVVERQRDTVNFKSPSSTPYGNQFPQADIVITNIKNIYGHIDYAYIAKTSSKVEILGIIGDIIGLGNGIFIKLDKRQTYLEFPSTYLSSVIDTYTADIFLEGAQVGYPAIDSIRARRNGYKTSLFDSWGTLKTPYKDYDCIRERITETSIDSVWGKIPFVGWQYLTTLSSQDSIYNWYAKDIGFPVMTVDFNSVGSPYSATFLWVETPPSIIDHPMNHIVNEGSSVTFSVVASGTDLNYQWQKDKIDIPLATDVIYVIDSVLSMDSGLYRCVVSNNLGSVSSNEAKLTVEIPEGIFELTLENNFSIYPNPANNKLNIKIEGLNNAEICIMDIMGKKIMDYKPSHSGNNHIDVSNIPVGIYICKLYDKDSRSEVMKKLIINR